MILGYHVIFCPYGFWPPNDPRGSWSDFVASWELLKFVPATKTGTCRSVANDPHDYAQRLEAKKAFKYPPVSFNGHQAVQSGDAIEDVCDRFGVKVHACSILPEHIHLVLGHTNYRIRYLVNQMKGKTTIRLIDAGMHPLADFAKSGQIPTPWARNCWRGFLYSGQDIFNAVDYVRCNPLKEGKREQR